MVGSNVLSRCIIGVNSGLFLWRWARWKTNWDGEGGDGSLGAAWTGPIGCA